MKPAEKKFKELSKRDHDINLFPNPSNGVLSVNFNSDKKSSLIVKVYDQQGKEVYSEIVKNFSGEYSNQLDLSKKGKENYILKITQDENTYIKKFIIE